MSQILNLKARGLYTNNNQLSEVPEGSLNIANNVVINSDSIIESRRGFERLPAFLNDADRADAVVNYQDKIIVRRSNDNKMAYFNGTTWIDYVGTHNHPASLARMRFTQANGNLYFTTSDGVKMLDSVTGEIYTTGLPQGLDGEASLSGSSGFMTNNTQVAYRVVWGTRDANNNLYLSAPSQRIVVANASGATKDVSLTFTIPQGISTLDFYQIYRSSLSATSSTEPNDELQLVYEANPTAGEITAKSITVIDSTPDSLKGASLYTNANSQEGIQESNNEPPLATDITVFKNFTFFSAIKTRHQLIISMLSVGGSSGVVNNDTLTIDGMVFTGKATTTIASREFKVFTSGSASQNIDDTAREIVKVINQYSGNTSIYARYNSGYTDLPGQILIERRNISASSFTITTSRPTAFNLNDGVSSNNDYPNAIMWSKLQQPEHVPNSHLEFVGSKSSPIRRIMALRDSLFILKDDGVYRLTGENGSWRIELTDSSTKIIAPESAVVLNNELFCLSDQGVVAISDVGVQVKSRQIENQLNELMGQALDGVKQYSFGISYETDRKYVLYTISNSADTYATQAFIFNTFTSSWVKSDKECLTGIINKTDDRLYISSPDSKYVLKERKTYSFRDYIDEEIDGITKLSYSGNIIFLNTVVGLTVGDLVYMNSSIFSPIIEIDVVSNSVTVNDAKAWDSSITIYKGINAQVEWVNQSCGNPGVDKHFQELSLLFREQNFNKATVSFYTDISGGYSNSTILGNYGGGLWGSAPWGSLPWGGIIRPRPIRVFVPREKSRGSIISIRFSHRVGFGSFSINGTSLQYEFVSERMNRI